MKEFLTSNEPKYRLAECIEILKGLRPAYEAHHRVEITNGAIEAAVKQMNAGLNNG